MAYAWSTSLHVLILLIKLIQPHWFQKLWCNEFQCLHGAVISEEIKKHVRYQKGLLDPLPHVVHLEHTLLGRWSFIHILYIPHRFESSPHNMIQFDLLQYHNLWKRAPRISVFPWEQKASNPKYPLSSERVLSSIPHCRPIRSNKKH